MNMTWVDLKPNEGIIRATGNGRTISASRIRGLGIVIEYVSNGSWLLEQLPPRLPSTHADKVYATTFLFIQNCSLSADGLWDPARASLR